MEIARAEFQKLGPTHIGVLLVLYENDEPMTMGDIQRCLYMSSSSAFKNVMSELLQLLVVERLTNREDKCYMHRLSANGRVLADALSQVYIYGTYQPDGGLVHLTSPLREV